MKAILFLHIAAGVLAILSGYAALFARKGGALHRRSGLFFVWAMLAMGLGAMVVGLVRGKSTWLGGPMVFYFVLTGLSTVRPLRNANPRLDGVLMILGLTVGITAVGWPLQAIASRAGAPLPPPVYASIVNGILCLLGVKGDFKVIRHGALTGKKRLHRHLWRMCFAMFVATGSFFLGQPKFIPSLLRISPLPIVLAVLPLLSLFYWLWRVRGKGRFQFAWPPMVRTAALALAIALAPTVLAAQATAQARALFERGRYGEARTALLALEKGNAKDASTAFYLGRIALAEGDADAAVGYLEHAVDLEETTADHHYWLGRALAETAPRSSKFRAPFIVRRVKKEWERAVALDSNNVDAHASLAGFYAMAPGFMGGSEVRAREQAAAAGKLNPLRGALARADVASSLKNWQEEEAAYNQAITIAPDTTAGYAAYADAYVRTGRPDAAFATIAKYQARRPDDAWGQYFFGRLAGSPARRDNGSTKERRHFNVCSRPHPRI